MDDCKHHQKYGGPSSSKETCKACGKEWTRHRLGSHDWEYKDCPECSSKSLKSKIQEALNNLDGKAARNKNEI